jgi:hypothetical protein
MKIHALGAAFAALFTLAACATQPAIPYDRAAATDNRTIGLLTPGLPSGPTSFLASSPGRSFGLIGALVDATLQSNRDSDLKKILQDRPLDVRAHFIEQLTKNLEEKGYKVVPVTADGTRNSLLKKYPDPVTGIDSYLDVAIPVYGYLATGIGDETPYRPWLSSTVKLVRSSDSLVLMQDVVLYNSIGETQNAVTLSPDPRFAFVNWSDTRDDPEKVADGVAEAAARTAAAIGNLLK